MCIIISMSRKNNNERMRNERSEATVRYKYLEGYLTGKSPYPGIGDRESRTKLPIEEFCRIYDISKRALRGWLYRQIKFTKILIADPSPETLLKYLKRTVWYKLQSYSDRITLGKEIKEDMRNVLAYLHDYKRNSKILLSPTIGWYGQLAFSREPIHKARKMSRGIELVILSVIIKLINRPTITWTKCKEIVKETNYELRTEGNLYKVGYKGVRRVLRDFRNMRRRARKIDE